MNVKKVIGVMDSIVVLISMNVPKIKMLVVTELFVQTYPGHIAVVVLKGQQVNQIKGALVINRYIFLHVMYNTYLHKG